MSASNEFAALPLEDGGTNNSSSNIDPEAGQSTTEEVEEMQTSNGFASVSISDESSAKESAGIEDATNASPITGIAAEIEESNDITVVDNRSTEEKAVDAVRYIAYKAFGVVEYIGEAVVDFLGLEDSMYQDVLDNMTEEEMKYACEVNFEREEEYRRLFAAQQSRLADENAPFADEGGFGGSGGEEDSTASGTSATATIDTNEIQLTGVTPAN